MSPNDGTQQLQSHPRPKKGQNETQSSRTARHGTPNHDGKLMMRELKRSTRLSVYLYIGLHYKLTDEQREFIAHFQAKLDLSEIQSALKFAHILTTDPRTRKRMRIPESQERVETLVPILYTRPKIRDRRRIGVGYRDKGSLPTRSRPDWERDNTLWMGYSSTAMEDHQWNLTVLWDPPENSEEMQPKVLPPQGGPDLDRIFVNPKGYVLTQESEFVWKISLPDTSQNK